MARLVDRVPAANRPVIATAPYRRIRLRFGALAFLLLPGLPAQEAAAARPWRLEGRVLDERRFPVPEVVVRLPFRDRPGITAVSDERGHYALDLGSLPLADLRWPTLLASDRKGRAASAIVECVNRVDQRRRVALQEDLVLGPARTVTVAVGRDGRPVPGASVELGIADSFRGFLGRLVTGEDGIVRFTGLHHDSWRDEFVVQAWTGPTLAGRTRIESPLLEDLDVVVDVAPAGSLDVRVVDPEGHAVAGATLDLSREVDNVISHFEPLAPVAPTDASGRTRIEGLLPDERLHVVADAPGFDPSEEARPETAREDIELALKPYQPVKWRLAGTGAPPEGASIRIEPAEHYRRHGDPACGPGVVSGGELLAPEDLYWTDAWIATAPNGDVALLGRPREEAPPVVFGPPRSLEIALRHRNGRPAARLPVALFRRWEAGVEDQPGPVKLLDWTDPEGRARFDGLVPGRYETTVCRWRGRSIDAGTADLRVGSARIEPVLPDPLRVELTLRMGSRAGLPSRFEVDSEDAWLRQIDEDPEKGLLVFDAIPDGNAPAIHLQLSGDGILPAVVTVPSTATEPHRQIIDLGLAPVVEVRFSAPGGKSSGLSLQRWYPPPLDWQPVSKDLLAGATVPGREYVRIAEPVLPMEPGWYRFVLREKDSEGPEWPTLPFQIRGAGERVNRRLDLRRTGTIEGRIEAADAAGAVRIAEARILPLPDRSPAPGGPDRILRDGTAPGPDGTFAIRWLDAPPAALAVRHPILRGAPDMMPIEGPGPHADCRFRLVPGPTATFRPRLDLPPEFAVHGRIRALLFPGDPSGDPVSEHEARWTDGVATFGGFRPGKWTVVLDPPSLLEIERDGTWVHRLPSRVPAVLPGVTLGEAVSDLGEVAFEEGLEVRIRIDGPVEDPPPTLLAEVEALDAPRYRRAASNRGLRGIPVSGLRPGRVRVRVSWLDPRSRRMAEAPLLDEEATLAPGPPATFTVTLR